LLTRNEILRLKSLHTSKGRKNNGSILIEGLRLVEDCLESQWSIINLFITESSLDKPQYQSTLKLASSCKVNQIIISEKDINRISSTKNPQGIAIEISLPKNKSEINLADKIIYLDNISDPGNLGTIIRTAVWFGIEQIICSKNCVSVWNSKVIRSAMGAHFKIDLKELEISDMIQIEKFDHQIIGATMNGVSMDNINKNISKWVLVLGNEAHGLTPDIEKLINQKITIKGSGNQESLNVAIAGGIILNYLSN
jgi:RNA methyltransferase, TrmH family